jgi:hypothetical protein
LDFQQLWISFLRHDLFVQGFGIGLQTLDRRDDDLVG